MDTPVVYDCPIHGPVSDVLRVQWTKTERPRVYCLRCVEELFFRGRVPDLNED